MNSDKIRLSPDATSVIRAAHDQAVSLKHSLIDTEHLLLAILDDPATVFEIQKYFNLRAGAAHHRMMEALEEEAEEAREGVVPKNAARFNMVLALSERIARDDFKSSVVTPIHLFLGLLKEGNGNAACALNEQGIRFKDALREFVEIPETETMTKQADMLPGFA